MPHFTTSDGLSLYYTDSGEGLPVLALSGLTRNSADFQFVRPHLKGVRFIAMDYRGRGKSDNAADYHDYNLIREGADALELLDHLGIDKAALLGTSRGGLIALVLAPQHRARLLGVAFNDIGPALDPSGLAMIADYIGRRPVWHTLEEAARARPSLYLGFENVPHERWLAEVGAQLREDADGLHLTYDPKLRDAVQEAAGSEAPDLWPLYDALRGMPLAVIHGVNSNLLSRATVEEMAARNPDLIVAHVAGRAHVPFLDEPEALSALTRWIEAMQ